MIDTPPLLIMDGKLNGVVKQYLDKVYGDLDCLVSEKTVVWYKDGSVVASVSKGTDGRLKLRSKEFNTFRNIFSLSWDNPEDEKPLLDLIVPYLKFNGGTPAIPVLVNLGFIDGISHIALPSYWN
jgi:hypothetical protein